MDGKGWKNEFNDKVEEHASADCESYFWRRNARWLSYNRIFLEMQSIDGWLSLQHQEMEKGKNKSYHYLHTSTNRIVHTWLQHDATYTGHQK